jgi:hypothetical protein
MKPEKSNNTSHRCQNCIIVSTQRSRVWFLIFNF